MIPSSSAIVSGGNGNVDPLSALTPMISEGGGGGVGDGGGGAGVGVGGVLSGNVGSLVVPVGGGVFGSIVVPANVGPNSVQEWMGGSTPLTNMTTTSAAGKGVAINTTPVFSYFFLKFIILTSSNLHSFTASQESQPTSNVGRGAYAYAPGVGLGMVSDYHFCQKKAKKERIRRFFLPDSLTFHLFLPI